MSRKGKGWTPERRAAQRARLTALMTPAMEAQRKAALSAHHAANKELHSRTMIAVRRRPDHPYAVLPEMTKAERYKYRYWRNTIGREYALTVIAADREAT